MSELLCLHCEKRPRSQDPRYQSLRLCDHCAALPEWRAIYQRRKGWTRGRDRRIQAMVERAKARLPLFEELTVRQDDRARDDEQALGIGQ